ncbi:MAG: glycosyltransferase family 4 protein [Nitrososphaerales archaeon]
MKFVLRHINKFLAAKSTVDYYAAIYPQIKYKTEVMPTSAVPTELFKPMNKVLLRRKYRINQESKLVIFVGRVEKIKNLEFLIRSFALVKGKLPNAKLVIVGRGSPSYIKHLQKLAKNLNIGEEIIFLGERRYDEIPEILNCADVMALCSLTEGSPTVVREALACGVPVVSTDVGDVKMIIRNKYVGRIVEEDEKKFAEAIIDMLNVNAEVVREECVKLIKELKLDFESLGEKILSVYCEMLQQQMKFNDLRRCKS